MKTLHQLFNFLGNSLISRMIPLSLKKLLSQIFFSSPFVNNKKPIIINDLQFYLPPALVYGYTRRDFDPEITATLHHILRPGMKVLDVGANIGYFSLLSAKIVGSEGKVYSVEPGAENLTYLRKNIDANGLANTIEIFPIAAGAEQTTRDFYVSQRGTLNSFYKSERAEEIIQVDQVALDDLILENIDVIKLDIEGGEIEALKGMSNLLAANPSVHLIVEWNPVMLQQANIAPEDLPNFLYDAGFQLSILNKNGTQTDLELDELIPRLQSTGDLFGTNWYSNLLAKR